MSLVRKHLGIVAACIVLAAAVVSGCTADDGAGTSGDQGASGSMTEDALDTSGFTLTSPAFPPGSRLPAESAMMAVSGGENLSVPLVWSDPPAGTRSYVLAVVDRHPVARGWVHWLVVDIPPTTTSLASGASGAGSMPAGTRELVNSFGSTGWGGPQPPPGTGDHDYEFALYALDIDTLDVADSDELPAVEGAMAGHILGSATLTGTFSR